MVEVIAGFLTVLWLLGVLSFFNIGPYIHILFGAAVLMILVRLVRRANIR
ncbi:MAG: lmo0937 family membrane protein [Cellvibrionaceae bacterium]|nr:lmo0937 family membrane protein [Cellvibrionaceae bacterium]